MEEINIGIKWAHFSWNWPIIRFPDISPRKGIISLPIILFPCQFLQFSQFLIGHPYEYFSTKIEHSRISSFFPFKLAADSFSASLHISIGLRGTPTSPLPLHSFPFKNFPTPFLAFIRVEFKLVKAQRAVGSIWPLKFERDENIL
jgi:hypothetical protein